MVVAFGRIDRIASLLIVPYLVWLLFANAIIWYILLENSPNQGAATMSPASFEHEQFMGQAIEVARQNPQAPFGSVLVDRRVGNVVARGVNSSSCNPTWHGEIAAINDYVQQGGTDWSELTLYTTAEPCCMCQGALLWAGIDEVVYGISIPDLKELGWRQIDIPATEVVRRSWSPQAQVLAGVQRDECLLLFENARRN
jgi:tRNA(adenine34) deaminase